MRRISRMMVVVIAVAGVLVAPTTTTPAHAEILRERAKWCGGEEIRTCLWLNIDTTNHKIRGYAWIRDAIPGRNYDVAVSQVQIQESLDGGRTWDIGWYENPDHDGWFPIEDEASTDLARCEKTNFNDNRYRARAYFRWSLADDNSIQGDQWRTSYTIGWRACWPGW